METEKTVYGNEYADIAFYVEGNTAPFDATRIYLRLLPEEVVFFEKYATNDWQPTLHEVYNLCLDSENPLYIQAQAEMAIAQFSQLSFDTVEKRIPRYKYENALQVCSQSTLYPKYTPQEASEIKNHRERIEFECRNECYRLKDLLQEAATLEQIQQIKEMNRFEEIS